MGTLFHVASKPKKSEICLPVAQVSRAYPEWKPEVLVIVSAALRIFSQSASIKNQQFTTSAAHRHTVYQRQEYIATRNYHLATRFNVNRHSHGTLYPQAHFSLGRIHLDSS